MVAFFVFLGIMLALGVLYAWTQWRRMRSHIRLQIARQAETRRRALEADPFHQAALDREHRRRMEWAQLQVQSYLQLHRAPQETFLIDMPGVTVTALPSLKRATERPQSPALSQNAESLGELPTSVLYEEIRAQIPRGHILVGIGRQGIETKERAVGACVWIVGLSGTGKTSTTVLRVEERASDGHCFLGVDPHWFKPDSLYHAIYELEDRKKRTVSPGPYAHRFALPMAKTPEESLQVYKAFLNEFNARKAGQRPKPWQKITLLSDEVGAQMDKAIATTPEEKEIIELLPSIARICGQEARNFDMGGIFISQQATGLAWLAKVALMVIVHQLQREAEKKLATNNDPDVMREMKYWPIGRTYVFGVGFGTEGPRTVQQPYFQPVVEADPGSGAIEEEEEMEELHPLDAQGTFGTPLEKPMQQASQERPDMVLRDDSGGENAEEKSLPENVRPFPQNAQNSLSERSDVASEDRPKAKEYRLNEAEIPQFIAAYKASDNVDKALAAIGHGARYRQHASEIIRVYGLRKEA